ncbi:FMN phosphatase YigB, HAD superfamily [Paenibacillus catalpae]|uniref:FMN phosphatase YigB, HAD superfamily n=1 Tax=Paenibacillus catalpae TaxID=1045775 RepID=A0A1I1XQP3_9BACL|nr:HAD family hydrolase [Paenibacillus catalpae]SFE08063.1 FMN phosphatase YigB, HAD superfamily [Paenibacillus catalpae]
MLTRFGEKWLSEIRVVIFDMDGTLYQEDTFLERYIRYMLEGTEHERESNAAVKAGRAILTGEHPFQFGHFYHKADRLALLRHQDSFIQGYTWDGECIGELASGYGPLTRQAEQLIPIGDPWGIASVIGHKYRLAEEKMAAAFVRVREEMIREPYRFSFNRDLFRAIEELKGCKRVLMTNTYLESGNAFLDYMGIRDLFEEVYCGAQKPHGIRSYFESLLKQGWEAQEILSIGDNPWNDLHPVKGLGGRTCFISPYPSSDSESWDLRLTTVDELAELMRAMQQSITRGRRPDGEDRAEKHKQKVQG